MMTEDKETEKQYQNNCKHHNVGRYNCWVNWPLRCCLDTRTENRCPKFIPKDSENQLYK